MSDLSWTGERLVTSLENEFLVYEHLHRYAFARKFCGNKIVLDIACGEGYGTYLLSQKAHYVYGVDIDGTSILHATKKYEKQESNFRFKTGSCSAIPLDDNSIDVAVSFETIEHHNEHEEMLKEIKRVLKPDGVLIISSPNKEVFNQRSTDNFFHVKELGFEEFKILLQSYFKSCVYFKQYNIVASLIAPMQDSATAFYTFDGDYTGIEENITEDGTFNKHYFNVAVCADKIPGEIRTASIFNASKSINSILEKSRNQVLKSTSYKIGNLIVTKFSFLKKFVRRK
jgi:ubiquinone/menaquinone biosynthesis C-methylase UbiE